MTQWVIHAEAWPCISSKFTYVHKSIGNTLWSNYVSMPGSCTPIVNFLSGTKYTTSSWNTLDRINAVIYHTCYTIYLYMSIPQYIFIWALHNTGKQNENERIRNFQKGRKWQNISWQRHELDSSHSTTYEIKKITFPLSCTMWCRVRNYWIV